jgi:acetyl esterase/lipase
MVPETAGDRRNDMTHIIVLPGGGYAVHAPRSSEPVVEWLQSQGVDASVFRYPVKTRHPAPLAAIRGAIRERRASGDELVGVIGFSAGGHAAGLAAYAAGAAADERVDFAILCFPVVSMETEKHSESRINLLGADATAELRAATSLDRLVGPDSPPTFLWHTIEDTVVPIEHAYRLAPALARAGVPHEFHVFTPGNHGLVLARGAGPAEAWTSLCATWLRANGWAP